MKIMMIRNQRRRGVVRLQLDSATKNALKNCGDRSNQAYQARVLMGCFRVRWNLFWS